MSDDARRSSSAAIAVLVAAFVLFALGMYPLANRLTGGEAVPWYGHVLFVWLIVGGAIILALFLASRFLPGATTRAIERVSGAILGMPAPLFLLVTGAFAFVACAAIAVYCFGRQPHNADEVAQLFHANILLSGRLSLPPDANPEFFGMDNMIERGRWYSQFPIGWPMVLALGTLFRVAWLVNPLLLALTVVPLYAFARTAYDEATARGAAMLLALAPFALFMSASFMNHTPVAFLAAVAMASLAAWTTTNDPRRVTRSAAAIGFALGAAFTMRPLDALVVAGVIGLAQLATLRTERAKASSLAVQVVAGLIPVAVLFYVNWKTTGAPMRLGYEVLYGNAHSLGFHVDPYGTTHTPLRALTFASKYLLQLNTLLFEWPLPAIGIVIAGLFALRRPSRWDLLLVALVCSQALAYALYWHDGNFRGPRFLFTAVPAFIILVARAPLVVAARTHGSARRTALLVVPACVLIAWLAYGMSDSVAGRVRMYRRTAPVLRVSPDSVARAAHLDNALVFVNEGQESRNQHALWALGLSRGNTARLMVSASPCAVRTSIEKEQSLAPAREAGRLDRLVRGALAFDQQQSPGGFPVTCAEDLLRDAEGTAFYGPFFPRNGIDRDGRMSGKVVYVLDLGEHDEALRARFGNRTWYRFGPSSAASDSLPTLVPYAHQSP
ncbi:MAG: hypothetical protein ABIY52_03500 [Gemmatimonadaceae bacterium]